jgi:hypothetical protein
VSELPLKIELELFEQVKAAPETELLRVALRVTGDDRPGSRPALLLERGDRKQRRRAILAPGDIDGVLRAAYVISTNTLTEDTRFALEFVGGTIVDLPAPIPGQARATRPEGLGSESDTGSPDSSRTKAELRSELVVAWEQAAVAQSREIEFAALAIEAETAAAELQEECERLSALNLELSLPPAALDRIGSRRGTAVSVQRRRSSTCFPSEPSATIYRPLGPPKEPDAEARLQRKSRGAGRA